MLVFTEQLDEGQLNGCSETVNLYHGRFKWFPIQSDGHLLTVMRYVERNSVRPSFIELAEEWQWDSAYARLRRAAE